MSRNQKRVSWFVLLLFILGAPSAAVFLLVAKERPSVKETSKKPREPFVASLPPAKDSKQRVEGEVVSLTPHGFEPKEITRPHKQFALIVENRSGLASVDFRLDREQGNNVRQAHATREQSKWSDVLDLPPGQYVLSEAAHPAWVCRITVASGN